MTRTKRPYFHDPDESFEARTKRVGDCLIWLGGKGRGGYGVMRVGRKQISAHRFAWERENGPIPDGMMVDHREHCDPACVEVKHLRLATPAQNMANRDGASTRNASTGVRNVAPNGSGYMVRVRKDRKDHYFGTYPTIAEAAQIAEEARKKLFGDYAGRG